MPFAEAPALADTDGVGLADAEPVGLALGVGLPGADPVGLALGVGVGDVEPVGLGVGVGVGDAEGVGLPVGAEVDDEGEGDPDVDGDGLGVVEALGPELVLAPAEEGEGSEVIALASAGSCVLSDSPETRKPPVTRPAITARGRARDM